MIRLLAVLVLPSILGAQTPELVSLAPDVWAVIRPGPIGYAQHANSLVIVGDRDVLVVDAQFTRAATLETLAAIRRVTRLPVGVVVNTHWHDDHVAGTQVYQDSFPDVRVVRHRNTVRDLARLGGPNRVAQVRGAPPVADRFAHLADLGLGLDSTPGSALELRAMRQAVRIIRQYVRESAGHREVDATDTVDTGVTMQVGRHRVEIRWFGCANTEGDLAVFVPTAGILAAGDLVVHPVPFAFGAFPGGWADALDSLAARAPAVIVPGHGPVLRDLSYLRAMRALLAEPRNAGRWARARDNLTGGEPWWIRLFDRFFAAPVTERAETTCTGQGP